MNEKFLVYCVVAARPNFVKMAPLLESFKDLPELQTELVHTGQHYDHNMSDVFFRQLGMPKPDHYLGIGSGSHAEQTGKLMIAFEKLCLAKRPDLVLVVGDVNATMACSLVASKLHISVAHVEAGLRSRDRGMPEEINRIVTDSLSDLLFTTSRDADQNLLQEGVAAEKIHFVGNVMVDTLLKHKDSVAPDEVKQRILGDNGQDQFALLTMHRPSNVDKKEKLSAWVEAFENISKDIRVVCPVHPRTQKNLERFDLMARFAKAIKTIEPVGYFDFIALMQRTRLIVSDSGGLQEEATILGIPCLTIRTTTERPVTIDFGTNRLIGDEPRDMVKSVKQTLAQPKPGNWPVPELWDGKAAARIARLVLDFLKNNCASN